MNKVFRPFTLGSLRACHKLALTIFTDGATQIEEAEMHRQFCAFAWIQTEPIDLVVDALRRGEAETCVEHFAFGITPKDIEFIGLEIARVASELSGAAVDVVPKPSQKEESGRPPNS